MAEKVKLSKDGNSIDFVQSDNIPTSLKKFRQSPEIEGFYRFIYENDLQKEAFEILDRIVNQRKAAKKALKQEAAQTRKQEKAEAKEQIIAALDKNKKIEKANLSKNDKQKVPAKKPDVTKSFKKAASKVKAKTAPKVSEKKTTTKHKSKKK